MQKNLTNRLTKGSPERETKINFVLGSGRRGETVTGTVSTFQGCKDPHSNMIPPRNLNMKKNYENKSNTFAKDFKEIHNKGYTNFLNQKRITQTIMNSNKNLNAMEKKAHT